MSDALVDLATYAITHLNGYLYFVLLLLLLLLLLLFFPSFFSSKYFPFSFVFIKHYHITITATISSSELQPPTVFVMKYSSRAYSHMPHHIKSHRTFHSFPNPCRNIYPWITINLLLFFLLATFVIKEYFVRQIVTSRFENFLFILSFFRLPNFVNLVHRLSLWFSFLNVIWFRSKEDLLDLCRILSWLRRGNSSGQEKGEEPYGLKVFQIFLWIQFFIFSSRLRLLHWLCLNHKNFPFLGVGSKV